MAVSDFLSKLKQRVSSQIPVNKTGMWYQDDEVIVPSNRITMKGPEGEDDYFEKPILGTGVDSGKQVMMQPGEEYEFPDDSAVHEQYMQLGGIKTGITNINPQGDIAYGANKKIGNFSAGMQGSVNAPSLTAGSINPSLSYQKGNFSARATPTSFGAAVEGRKAYASYDQNKEGQTMYRNASAGYNTDKVNLNADVNFRDNSFEGGQVSGSYNFTPNLSVTGNYGVNKGDAGLEKNYFAGFRYNKSFQTGGWANWKPNTGKPFLRTSPAGNAGYSDNARVAPVVSNSKPIVQRPINSRLTPSMVKKLAAMSETEDRIYSDNTSVYAIPPMSLAQRQKFETEEDYRQSKEVEVAGRLLNVLPTPLASYIRGLADQDNATVDFTESQQKAAAYAIAKAEDRKSGAGDPNYTGSFDYADYPAGYRDEEGGAHNPALSNLFNLPSLDGKTSKRLENVSKYWGSAMMQPTLGKANFKKYNDDEYLIHDRYNFDSYNPNSKSIVDRAEKFANEWGVETETNLTVPVKYVEEARKQIALEAQEPKVKQPEQEPKSVVKPIVTKTTPKVSQPVVQKSKLQQTYEQTKPSFKKMVSTSAVQPKQTTPTKQKSSTGSVNSEQMRVQNYQKMLNEKYGAGLEADGAWGPKTQAAYEKYITKKQMQMGANTGFGMTLEAATYVPGPVGMYASGASALSNIAQGDYVGAGLDALNIATAGTAKGLMGVARAANAIRPYSNLALNAAQAGRSVNRVAKKVAPVTRTAGTINELTASNSTMRVPQRDNAQVQFRPNPNMRRMEEGGEVEDDDDKEMVEGVASILRRVKDKNNRQDLAKQLSKQFNREKVKYNLTDFLNKSKVKK